MSMPVDVRPLTVEELPAAWELGRLAFGGPAQAPTQALEPVPGMVRYGAFDGHGRLVGKATDRHHEQWWAGRRVVAADVAGVAVAPGARGRGMARTLLSGLLRSGRERGAAVSALYPTVAAPYRSLGWEVVGALSTVELSTRPASSAPTPSTTCAPWPAATTMARSPSNAAATRSCHSSARCGFPSDIGLSAGHRPVPTGANSTAHAVRMGGGQRRGTGADTARPRLRDGDVGVLIVVGLADRVTSVWQTIGDGGWPHARGALHPGDGQGVDPVQTDRSGAESWQRTSVTRRCPLQMWSKTFAG